MAKDTIVKDYTQMKKADLQAELKKRKVSFKKSDKRDDLIALLVATEKPKVKVTHKSEVTSNVVISIWGVVAIIAIIAILVKVL